MQQDRYPARGPGVDYLEEYGVWWPTYNERNQRHIDYWKTCQNDWKPVVDLCTHKRVCIQAGGSIGTWAQQLAQHFTTVYTFEPHPDLYQCLVRNCTAENVIKMQAVLGDERGCVNIRFKSFGGHWVKQEQGTVPTIVIDDLNLLNLDALILDVEGFEYYVLKGAKETIKRCRPVIQLESKGLESLHDLPPGLAHKYLINTLGYVETQGVGDDVIYLPLQHPKSILRYDPQSDVAKAIETKNRLDALLTNAEMVQKATGGGGGP